MNITKKIILIYYQRFKSFFHKPGQFIAIFCLFCCYNASLVMAQNSVTITESDENIPTYLSGAPDPSPMFFFGRGTQGAEQRIYPYPLYDNLTNKKADKSYHIIYLENEYVKVGIAPELGGKLFSAVDKTNNYDFIYRQHVIKPALIGLTGAWISGGLEWNIPHHHRATTFVPVQYSIENGRDGSKTVWVGELEIRHRMRWSVGYTLSPGSSIVKCTIHISNRTPVENTMLCFANIAVSINKDYQVIFPPHTQWSTGHSKREFNPWPIVNGVDMSWYKNNKTSNSWFAVNDEDDFVAGYDHGKNAGILNIANHHIVAGKKFFTWGVGNMWDKILTDNDGPYLEIMVGAYSDNQPDYSWLQPSEERSFDMMLFPFRNIGGVKNANQNAAVNFEIHNGKIEYGFYATRSFPNATITLQAGDKILAKEQISINPGKPYSGQVYIPAGMDGQTIRASLTSEGQELISYSPVKLTPITKPVGYTDAPKPGKIENIEELFLAGQRIDQFHNPTLDADSYWEEVLKRDSGNVAANTGMGIVMLKKARYTDAEQYLKRAISRLTSQYTTPKNVEPIYYLGIVQKAEGKYDDAFTTLYKATWKQEWKAPAFYSLAEIASLKGDYTEALDLINQSLDANALNIRAYALKSAILRHLNRSDEAQKTIAFAKSKCDKLDTQLMAEEWLATKNQGNLDLLCSTIHQHPVNAEEIAAGYLNSGQWDDGITVLSRVITQISDKAAISPLVYYYLGYFAERTGNMQQATVYRKQAALQPFDYVFPFQQEMIPVLRSAILANQSDARAPYYLGNLLYDWQPQEALLLWENASKLDPGMPIVWRNLGIAYSHLKDDDAIKKAIICFEKAINISKPYPTHLVELDQLYKAEGIPVAKRLALLEKNKTVVSKKDDALGALINLKIFNGEVNEAISLMQNRIFNIWEGGSAFNTGQAWADAHLIKGLTFYKKKQYTEALSALEIAMNPPENLRAEGSNTRLYQIKYWIGCVYESRGDKNNAQKQWSEIISSDTTTAAYGRWNSGLRQMQRYYVALSKAKLDPAYDTVAFMHDLCNREKNMHLDVDNRKDYQFVHEQSKQSLDDRAYPYYLAGLGYLGLGDKKNAQINFEQALIISPDFLSAKIELDQLK